MSDKPYHHGDLKQALIEKGLEYICEHGTDTLSLRKLAALCGVSNAAPYAHFKDKDELLSEIRAHIMQIFTGVLEECIEKNRGNKDILCELGCEYVRFFRANPVYFSFLFSSHPGIQILSDSTKIPPFELFRSTAYDILGDMPEDMKQDKIIAMWAMVHGLAAILAEDNDTAEEKVRSIIMALR